MDEHTEYIYERIENRIETTTNVSEKIFILEETLIGKENLISDLVQEIELLKNKMQLSVENMEEFNLTIPGRGVLSTLEQYHSKLDEFENALHERDEAIKVLTHNLKLMTENRDSLQVEYTVQVDQLASQIQTLQSQLKQAGAWLSNPIGDVPMLALLEAKNEILAQQEDCRSKELHVRLLQEESRERELFVLSLQANMKQKDEGIIKLEYELRNLQEWNSKLKAQLKLNISVHASESSSSDVHITSLQAEIVDLKIQLEKAQLASKNTFEDSNTKIEKLMKENALYISKIEELRLQSGLLEYETSLLAQQQKYIPDAEVSTYNNIFSKDGHDFPNVSFFPKTSATVFDYPAISSVISVVNSTKIDGETQTDFFVTSVDQESDLGIDISQSKLNNDFKVELGELQKNDQLSNYKTILLKEDLYERQNALQDTHSEMRHLKDELQRLGEGQDAKVIESAQWRDQYLLLSQQNVSSAKLVGDMAHLMQKNFDLLAEINTLKSQLQRAEVNEQRWRHNAGSMISSEIFEKGLDELRLMKQSNITFEDSLLTSEALEIRLERELQKVRDERDDFYGQEIQRLNEEMKNYVLVEKNKRENEVALLIAENEKLSIEVDQWQRQYVLLSQQNVSGVDLVEKTSQMVIENIALNSTINELNLKIYFLQAQLDLHVHIKNTIKEEKQTAFAIQMHSKDSSTEMDSAANTDELESKLLSLRSEMEEIYGDEIHKIKLNSTEEILRQKSQYQNEIDSLRHENERLTLELSNWRNQYILLSQKNISDADHADKINELINENSWLKSNYKELKISVISMHRFLGGDENITDLKGELDVSSFKLHLESIMAENKNLTNKLSILEMQIENIHFEEQVLRSKVEQREKEVEKYKNEIKIINDLIESNVYEYDMKIKLLNEEKKEKSTDCDSAVIPLLCVHG